MMKCSTRQRSDDPTVGGTGASVVTTQELANLRARLWHLLRHPSAENARAQSVLYYLIESEIQRNIGTRTERDAA